MDNPTHILEAQLNDFDSETRADALTALLHMANRGSIPLTPPTAVANLHCHTSFSYNAYGYSPTALAWLAKKNGYTFMGIVDFDVLDGVDEFLTACDLAGIRGSAGMETRVFIPEFATREINSPGEPGIFYYMGIGFASGTIPDTEPEAQAVLHSLRERAAARNRDMMDRVNTYLAPVTLDYDRDVLPLTPSGNATERHMVAAYLAVAQHNVPDPVAFWAEKLHTPPTDVATIIDDAPKIQKLVRAKLMKRGGVGYVRPSPETFPTVEEVNAVTLACAALPCATWLDGTSTGEQAEDELLELLTGKGVVALNIIPDRNWNLADPETKHIKLHNLYTVVELAQSLDLPLIVGTEMNAPGNKLVDDFATPELAPVRQAFLDGAAFIYGHTLMQRALGRGYGSNWAHKHLTTRKERNAFYTEIGEKIPPGAKGRAQLQTLQTIDKPGDILEHI